MLGHGSPHTYSVHISRWTWHRKCHFERLLPWCVVFCALSLSDAALGETVDLRLRVAWGGGTARQWTGSLSVENGTLSDLEYLGLDADEAATIYLESNTVSIRQRAGRDYDGFDIRVQAPLAAPLTLEIAPQDHPEETQRIQVPLLELVSGYHHRELDTQHNQLLIQRSNGDQLRVKFDQDAVVFSPGEALQFQVIPHLLGIEDGAALRCDVQLVPARDDRVLWEKSADLQVQEGGKVDPLVPMVVTVPEEEGAYEVLISVYRKKTFRNTFSRSKAIVQRKLQFMVLAQQPRTYESKPWKLIDTIDPNHASWMEWLTRVPKLPLLPDFRQEPLGNDKSSTIRHSDQEFVQLAPGGWQAYPLSIETTGKPHLLEIEYSSDVPQTLGISIIEPNAVGKVVPLGLDSGIFVPDRPSVEKPRILVHKLLFWPRTATPLVLLTNRSENDSALFGRIRVQAGPDGLPASPAFAQLEPPTRLLAAYFDKPLFPENFCASESADEWTGRSLKDWVTFYEGGRRLVEYLKYVGYNGAIISVARQGAAIYPSKLLTPNPKFDNGVFFSSGQDAVRKDVLEMLFRLFDREGLTLVPAVEFSSTLDELESLVRRQPGERERILLTEPLGRTWGEVHGTERGMAPHYNVLDPRVQSAMRNVLNELSDRYAGHPSFGGISLQMGPHTYALFPGEEWGQDRVTRARFEQDTGLNRVPESDAKHPESRERDRRKAWLAWRAEQLAKFHRDVLADLSTRRQDAQLYLLGAHMFTNPVIQPLLRPTLPNQLRLGDVLLQLGIDVDQYANEDRITFLRPERIAPPEPLITQAVNINLATNSAADHPYSRITPASLFYHEALPLSLPSFDAASPFGRENTQTFLFTEPTPSGAENRRRFVHHLSLRDVQCLVDGGWMLPLGQEDAVRPLLETMMRLPARPFETVTPEASGLPSQPLVVRTLTMNDRTYLYVVNDSPWPISAELDLEAPSDCQLQPLSSRTVQRPKSMGSQMTWDIDLEPYDVLAVLANSPVKVETWRVTTDRATYAQLREQVMEFNARAMMLDRPDRLPVLANPSFELQANATANDPLPGWVSSQGAGISVEIDTREAIEGKQSLKITSQGPVAWVRSDPFEPPETGRIAVIVRLKTLDADEQPPLQLSIDGLLRNGATYYKPFSVGKGVKVQPLATDWGTKPFAMVISDLPVNELVNLRVGFDLMGQGNVWVDDVQIYDHWFPKNERDDLMIMRGLAARSLSMGQIADCERILSGYWPQFLAEYVSVSAPRVASVPEDIPHDNRAFPPPQPKDDDDKASMFDKVKRHLPSKVFPFKMR